MSLDDFDNPKKIEEVLENLKEIFKNQKECAMKGHLNAKYSYWTHFRGEFLTHMDCPTCGHYTKTPTREERDIYIKVMNKPMTI